MSRRSSMGGAIWSPLNTVKEDPSEAAVPMNFDLADKRPTAPPREALSPEGGRFVLWASDNSRISQTAVLHPHIVNKLARLWPEFHLMAKEIDRLLLDDRPNRAGFQFHVLDELTNLKLYCIARSKAR